MQPTHALADRFGGLTRHCLVAGTAVAADAATKQRLREATQAHAIDLESGSVARARPGSWPAVHRRARDLRYGGARFAPGRLAGLGPGRTHRHDQGSGVRAAPAGPVVGTAGAGVGCRPCASRLDRADPAWSGTMSIPIGVRSGFVGDRRFKVDSRLSDGDAVAFTLTNCSQPASTPLPAHRADSGRGDPDTRRSTPPPSLP